MRFLRFALLLFLAPAVSAQGLVQALAERVVILVNERDPESLELGRYYARQRNIPEQNLLALDLPLDETITRQQYNETIHNPLLARLMEAGWVTGVPSTLVDEEGRTRSIVEGSRIAYLVICRGVPLRIANDPERITPQMERSVRKEFLTNAASVDSELALLLVSAPTISFVQNPIFRNPSPNPVDLARIIRVARLDGPTAGDARRLIDSALEAEQNGLRGRAYFDLSGPHPTGVEWLRSTADAVRRRGFDVTVREEEGIFPVATRFDAPALYFGWYAHDVGGPFAREDFQFAPGAVALHIHSFSARTLRSTTEGWTGPLVARGAAVTFGNVYEPYLELSHQPHLFMEALLAGATVGDAAIFAVQGLSWQTVLIGDPLYRPFARSLDQQVEQALAGEGGTLGSHAIIRQMNLLWAENKRDEAFQLGRKGMDRNPTLTLALRMAQMQVENRDRRQALATLGAFRQVRRVAWSDAMMVKEAADLLGSLNEHERALEIYEAILRETAHWPVEIRRVLLEEGAQLANRFGRNQLTREWRRQLEALGT